MRSLDMRKHYIVGTAGHIDHGKTTLSKALTGIDTDRLKEERERNISIELGFAPFKLPNGDQVSLIDVPGHEKFIKHMVAGVGGIDLFLLIIAADEGMMPQTKEHMQIIELLGIKSGIIVLTKSDLVEKDFLEYVQEEIRDSIKDSSLKDAPMITVSSVTNEGIEQLKYLIQEQLELIPERSNTGFFRMPIDRVFTLKGIGTVITGTIYSGTIEVGQDLEIMPSSLPVRVRSLHVHSESVNIAYAGQRVAINVTGIELNDLNRGDSIVSPSQWIASDRIDVELKLLNDLDFDLKQGSEVKLHIGTTEVHGTIILYDRKEAKAGETVYCQLKLDNPIISSRKERFIIRRPSPAVTIGGGRVIEPNASKHKYSKETVEYLQQTLKGSLEELILNNLKSHNQTLLTLSELSNMLILPEKDLIEKIAILKEQNEVLEFNADGKAFYISKIRFEQLEQGFLRNLENYHHEFPSRVGQQKVELLKIFFNGIKPKLVQEVFDYWFNKQLIKTNDEFISLYSFEPSLPKSLDNIAKKLENLLIRQGFSPDSWDELIADFGIKEKEKQELFVFLLSQGKILKLTDKMIIHRETFEELKKIITEFLEKEKQITLQDAKDLLGVSRKYLVPLMELLDNQKVTVLRQGNNYRELRQR